MKETRSTGPYCGVGCGVIIESDDTQITGVRGDTEHPSNYGRLCTKDSTMARTASTPITLHSRLNGQAVSRDNAQDHAAERFAGILTTHGPDTAGC
jgi:assimilatory nitrate reductase catalytic subunit